MLSGMDGDASICTELPRSHSKKPLSYLTCNGLYHRKLLSINSTVSEA